MRMYTVCYTVIFEEFQGYLKGLVYVVLQEFFRNKKHLKILTLKIFWGYIYSGTFSIEDF